MRLAQGVVIAGKYRLERPLARGGMGSLWEAQHAQLRVPLAIKFMEPTYAASAIGRTRFEREAMAMAQLRHPNVVHVQDYGVEGDLPYIVMELLLGEDLSKRLKRLRRLPLPVVATMLAQMAKALRRAHEGGFIHRDLKPSNIFLAQGNDEGEEIVKILDFGIAKQLMPALASDDNATKTGEILGSPSYMSPEQIRGAKDIDGRADLFSLGVILFRCLTGKLPFDGETTPDIIATILTSEIPSATRFVPSLPPGIDAFFQRALARDRDERFQNVRELESAFASVTRMPMGSMAAIEYTPPPSDTSGLSPAPGGVTTSATPPSFPSQPSHPSHPSLPSLPSPSEVAAGFPQTPAPYGKPSYPPADFTNSPGAGSAVISMPREAVFGDPRLIDTRPPEGASLPSAGTLTVSPSITGGDMFRPSARRPVGLWVLGAGAFVGVVVGLAVVMGGGSDAPSSSQEANSAPAEPSVIAPAAPTPEPPPPSPSVASSAVVGSTAAAASSASASPTSTAKTVATSKPRSGPRPSPGTSPVTKRKDWGI